MKIQTALFVLISCIISACNSSHIITAWKTEKLHYPPYKKIMVAGIVSSPDDSLRIKTEKKIADELQAMGYDAVTAFDEFGATGLQNLSEEQTYIRLCNRGIDAVIVIALIDISKEQRLPSKRSYGFPNNYYYNRIWNYRNITANIADTDTSGNTGYFWESILFNLQTLEAECTVQTKPFSAINSENLSYTQKKKILKQMKKEGILKVQKNNKPKPF